MYFDQARRKRVGVLEGVYKDHALDFEGKVEVIYTP
jgi:hypothetical protein